jgi:hypothetical protein
MKNEGVPFTPLRRSPRKSARTLGLYADVAKASRRSDSASPNAAASANRKPQSILVFVNAVMHVPELAMCAGEFCAHRRGFRIRMDLSERKVAEHKSQLSGEMTPHRVDDRMRMQWAHS